MCGIAGIVSTAGQEPVSLETLRQMAAMIQHRGPDGYGLYRDPCAGLASARLSIIDLEGGQQPISNEDGSVWIVFNGEIFNYLELRQDLLAKGHSFSTHSDTEVVVHAYEQYGGAAWKMFNGQFAIALWDSSRRELWLVRDRLGILPLYYACRGPRVIFGSECKAIFASGLVDPKPSPRGLRETFTRWAVQAPFTVFDGVKSLPPGTAIRFSPDLTAHPQTYWEPNFTPDPALAEAGLRETAEELERKLAAAVRWRLRADVPVGAYLSGGLDSSVIAALIHAADVTALQTFAVRFEDPAFDETPFQRLMSNALGTVHHEIVCDAQKIGDALPDVVWHCEMPLLRMAPVPLFLLSSLVRRNGMKVVMTGEGSDEILGGYDIFKADRVRRFWAKNPASTMRPALFERFYSFIGTATQRNNRMWQQFFGAGLSDVEDPFYSHRIRWQSIAWSLQFLSPELLAGDSAALEEDTLAHLPRGWRQWDPLSRAQLLEIDTFMTPYLLTCQGDRVAMGHGIEVRYPFLDPDVVDFCCSLDGRMRLAGLKDKVALRRMAARFLPPVIWSRPKQPYRAPGTIAFFGAHPPDYVGDLLSAKSLRDFGLVDEVRVPKLVEKARGRSGRMSGEREEMALLGVLTLQILASQYFAGFHWRMDDARRALDGWRLMRVVDRCADRCES
jgi:asparagine synthase (glutamine-hydrolysing)